MPVGISDANREVKVMVEPADMGGETTEVTEEQCTRFVAETAAPGWENCSAPNRANSKFIGPNDLMIAAIALANGLIVITRNTAEFCRLPGLVVEDWQ